MRKLLLISTVLILLSLLLLTAGDWLDGQRELRRTPVALLTQTPTATVTPGWWLTLTPTP